MAFRKRAKSLQNIYNVRYLSLSLYAGDGNVQPGFPMSSYLRQRGCQLGRNARTLASQAPDRLANDMKVDTLAVG